MDVLAFDPTRRTSAQAILDLVTLGYLNEKQLILDATYGKGRFWTKWMPRALWTNDTNSDRSAAFRYDYRNFPDGWGGLFSVTVFDPPFKLNGTGGSHASDDAYGVATPYRSLDKTLLDLDLGMQECIRVTKPGGLVIYKTQDQVSGGEKIWLSALRPVGAVLVDQIYINGGYRKQPKRKCRACAGTIVGDFGNPYADEEGTCPTCDGTGKVECPQKHSRSNVSVLQVYRRAA